MDSTSTGKVSAPNLGTKTQNRDYWINVTINISANGETKALDSQHPYQQANVETNTYGTPTVTVSCSDVPASGGSVTSGTCTYKQTKNSSYTSGSTTSSTLTSGGTVAWSGGVSNIASLGTTEKARSIVGTLTATVTMNSKSGNGSVSVYQQANVRT